MIDPTTVKAETAARVIAEARGVCGKAVTLLLVDGSTVDAVKVSYNRLDGRRVGGYFTDTAEASAVYNREVGRLAA